MKVCGAKNRGGGQCGHKAGWGTDHVGEGRCKLHGGATPARTTGRWSSITRDSIRQRLEDLRRNDSDPLDLIDDLNLMRALIQDYVERYDEWRDALLDWHESYLKDKDEAKPRQILDLADAVRLLEQCSKVAERLHKIRTTGAISLDTFKRIMEQMAIIAAKHVKDADALRSLEQEWADIRI